MISAIVVSWRTGPVLAESLRALIDDPAIGEVIVVDHGNDRAEDSLLAELSLREARFVLLRGQGNIGFARGCNLGARQARGAALMFVNPDAVLERGAAGRLAAALAHREGVTLVGGMLVDRRGREMRGGRRRRLTLASGLLAGLGLRGLDLRGDWHGAESVRVGAVSGAFMAMRREEFFALNGFDEGYFLHVEDLDLCRRVEEAGGAVLFVPGARAMHEGGSSREGAGVLRRHKLAGLQRYFRKFARDGLEAALARVLLSGAGLALLLRDGGRGAR